MKLVFYTKPDCPLCDEVREVLEETDCDWDEVNIYTAPHLIEKFRNDIPVVKAQDSFWYYRQKGEQSLTDWLKSMAII